jgi:hypothetical protein
MWDGYELGMSPYGTRLTLAELPHCLDEQTYVRTHAPTEFDPELTIAQPTEA